MPDREASVRRNPAVRRGGDRQITSRVLAALIPGFVLTNTASIFLALLLPGDRFIGVAWATVLSFALYTAIIIWVFSVRRLRTVWVGLLAAIALTGLGSWGLYLLESTP